MEHQLFASFLALAFVAFAALRLPGWRSPALIADEQSSGRWPGRPVGDGDEEQPETDRAPSHSRSSPALLAALVVVASVRVALLVTLHA